MTSAARKVLVDVPTLLHFFDECPEESQGHASAIVAILGEDLGAALLEHYLKGEGYQVIRHSGPCTTGKRKGPRLDRWVEVRSGGDHVLYQVEIKNYSAHAIGGKVLARSADGHSLSSHLHERWKRIWNDIEQTFRWEGLRKVLERMQPPRHIEDVVNGARQETLLCMWEAAHPEGRSVPFFTVPARTNFDRLHVFSMSIFLRTCGASRIKLEMPDTARRWDWLSKMLPEIDAISAT